MDLRHIKAFIALAEELHFGRAAERIGIAQPGISRLLKELEDDIGVKLIERTSRVVRLTPAGLAFNPSASKCIKESENAKRCAQAKVSGGVQQLRLGLAMGAAQPKLGEILKRFSLKHPASAINTSPIDETSLAHSVCGTQELRFSSKNRRLFWATEWFGRRKVKP